MASATGPRTILEKSSSRRHHRTNVLRHNVIDGAEAGAWAGVHQFSSTRIGIDALTGLVQQHATGVDDSPAATVRTVPDGQVESIVRWAPALDADCRRLRFLSTASGGAATYRRAGSPFPFLRRWTPVLHPVGGGLSRRLLSCAATKNMAEGLSGLS